MKLAVAVALVAASVAAGAQLPSCSAPLAISAHDGEALQGTLATPALRNGCVALNFKPLDGSGGLAVNVRGDYVFTGAAARPHATFDVVAQCSAAPKCVLTVVGTTEAATTPAPATPQPPTGLPACPKVYYFKAVTSKALTATLRDHVGEMPCRFGRAFTVTRQPVLGQVDLVLTGDFTYRAGTEQTWDDFDFAMSCAGAPACKGTAYILVSDTVDTPAPVPGTPAPAAATPAPGTTAPGTPAPAAVTRPFQQCAGTCDAAAWKATPAEPAVWDIDAAGGAPVRADGRGVADVDVKWDDGTLVVTATAAVGNVAARFPTFEPVQWKLGDSFTGAELLQRVSASSLPFDVDCLSLQGEYGLGEEVWVWTSIANKTGHAGTRYASGTNWYQKFGGKHRSCDTFRTNACQYAPLLTPPRQQDAAQRGVWSVEVSDCAVTWTGRFSFAAMRAMKKRDGGAVWALSHGHRIAATLYSEAVKPKSWLQPVDGVLTVATPHSFSVDVEPWATVVQESNSNSELFSLDAEYFQYTDASGDAAFGLNLLFYPHLAATAQSSYLADRHVMGFRWIEQAWSNPSRVECPTCRGADTHCALENFDSQATFVGPNFYTGNCHSPRVALSKGPSFLPADCPSARMHVYDRAGFSAPHACRSSFQNLTIRGVAPGSGSLADHRTFSFEGRVRVQLLLDNGQKPVVDIDLSLFAAVVAPTADLRGTIDVCRSAPYAPVLDPLGASLPDEPLPLSGAESGSLCVDREDRTFGPTGWAVVTLDVEDVPRASTELVSLYVQYEGSSRIYLESEAALPAGAVWWDVEAPFLNYRSITARRSNDTVMHGRDVGFAFTPGAVALPTTVHVVAAVRVKSAAGADRTVSFRQPIRVDPALSALSRFGPQHVVPGGSGQAEDQTFRAMAFMGGLAAAVVVVGVFVALSDVDKPLPKWLPRGLLRKKTIMSAAKAGGVAGRSTRNGIPLEAFEMSPKS